MPEHPRSYQVRVRNQRIKSLVFSLGIVMPIVFIVVMVALMFRVRTIRCSLDDGGVCEDAVIAELQQFQGKNIALLDIQPVEQKLKLALPELRSIQIQKKFPGTIETILVKEKVAFFLSDERKSYTYVVLENGRVLAQEQPIDEFSIEFVHQPKIGEMISKEVVLGLSKLAQTLHSQKLPLSSAVYLDENTITLTTSTGIQFVLRIPDIENQLSTLHAMFAEATMIQAARTVDLRFTRPVITPR